MGPLWTILAHKTFFTVKSQKRPPTRRRNEKRRQLYRESKREGKAPQSAETHSKVTASDPQHVIQEVEEVEENGKLDTRKALVTGTNDTTNFNASLDLDPRPIHLLTGGQWTMDNGRAGNCKMCNSRIPESDWSNYRGLGWDVHLISHSV